ncbi:MAG: hypothetical protein ABUT20_50570, partial [Bacteroidota bacterium]
MTKTIRAKIFLRLLIAPLAILLLTSAAALPGNKTGVAKKHTTGAPVYDTILVNKFSENRKYRIRMYPDAYKQVLLISADGKQKKDYRFFMFDMDGKLVSEAD